MPGNLPVPAGLEMRFIWIPTGVGAVAALNVLHWQQAPIQATDQARATAIATAVGGIFASSGLNACVAPSVTLAQVAIRDMAANTNPEFIGTVPAGVGTGTGDVLPPQVSLVVTHRTGSRGRSFQGRSYLWGFTETDNTATGNISTACSTAAAAFFTALRTQFLLAPQNLTFAVLSRFTTPPGSPPDTPPTERPIPILTPVTASIVRDTIWDNQRRRVT